MAVDRPTFSESWHRVSSLRPRLRSAVQIHRQHFRGQMWHVVQDLANNQFFRLTEAAYTFVAMLDGRRTVAEAWRICNDTLGDAAPTQGEVIQLLGQLYVSNLLRSDLPPDAEGLFQRYRKRVRREVKGYLTNFLFIRIPILDPDAFLDAGLPAVRWLYSRVGFALWACVLAMGVYFAMSDFDRLIEQGSSIFSRARLMGNLPLLYASFVAVKVFHEFSHAFACKKFGKEGGSGGEVHVMGVMFLVFMPLPYVDASSAWAFRSKWHRVTVGVAGMFVELAIAAVAAAVWASTDAGVVNSIAYNVMFIASVSTLLFNGNPLLRYDAYYILSDLVEIPNLAQRSKDYVYYLVKRYAWGVRKARNPAHSGGEKGWFAFYGVASTLYRVFILAMILLFLTDRLPDELFVIGAVLGLSAAAMWLLVPVGKFGHYLLTSGELTRVRGRAILSSLLTITIIVAAVGLIPAGNCCRVEGVVEPARLAFIHAETDGFVVDFMPSGRDVTPDGPALLRTINPELVARTDRLLAERRRLEARRRLAQTREIASAQILTEQIAALDEQIRRANEQTEALLIRAPFAGLWVSARLERLKGAYLRRGDRVGMVASPDEVILRAPAGQDVAATLINEALPGVEIRVKGRPEMKLTGTKLLVRPVGQVRLPSAALGYIAGGPVVTDPKDQHGLKAAKRFFEVHVAPDRNSGVRLLSGQRVVARFRMPHKPLLAQWWRSLRQLFQRRFHV